MWPDGWGKSDHEGEPDKRRVHVNQVVEGQPSRRWKLDLEDSTLPEVKLDFPAPEASNSKEWQHDPEWLVEGAECEWHTDATANMAVEDQQRRAQHRGWAGYGPAKLPKG